MNCIELTCYHVYVLLTPAAFFQHHKQDFAEYNYTWTKALCMLDSDGDGFSNGVELGDPECQVRLGQNTQHSTA